jgi:hypothetical protein
VEHADAVIPAPDSLNQDVVSAPETNGRRLQASTTTIDILFVFTPAAASALGGSAAAINKITSAVGLTNTIYSNSKINVRLNLVKASQVGRQCLIASFVVEKYVSV